MIFRKDDLPRSSARWPQSNIHSLLSTTEDTENAQPNTRTKIQMIGFLFDLTGVDFPSGRLGLFDSA